MNLHLIEDLAGLAGIGILVYLAASWLLRRFGRGTRKAAGAELSAWMDDTAARETGVLARHGHAMTSWRTSPALGGLAGCCAGCGGVCLITATAITYEPPLADDAAMLECRGVAG